MQEQIIYFFERYEHIAILISLLISIIIAILGIVPSFFITGANLVFFGFWTGTIISFLGEVLGAGISFLLYRKGFKKLSRKHLNNYPKLKKLIDSEKKDAFLLIILLRLLPFMPSGLVTFASSVGRVSFFIFIFATFIGKIPSILIEAFSAYQIINVNHNSKWIMSILSLIMLGFFIYKKIKDKNSN